MTPNGNEAKTHPEVGRELLLADLQVKTIYVLIGDHRPQVGMTAWYIGGADGVAIFDAKMIGMMLLLAATSDGELYDDMERRIRVYEYKGEA